MDADSKVREGDRVGDGIRIPRFVTIISIGAGCIFLSRIYSVINSTSEWGYPGGPGASHLI